MHKFVKLSEITSLADFMAAGNSLLDGLEAIGFAELGLELEVNTEGVHIGSKSFLYPFLNIDFWQHVSQLRQEAGLLALNATEGSNPTSINLREVLPLKAVKLQVVC